MVSIPNFIELISKLDKVVSAGENFDVELWLEEEKRKGAITHLRSLLFKKVESIPIVDDLDFFMLINELCIVDEKRPQIVISPDRYKSADDLKQEAEECLIREYKKEALRIRNAVVAIRKHREMLMEEIVNAGTKLAYRIAFSEPIENIPALLESLLETPVDPDGTMKTVYESNMPEKYREMFPLRNS